MSTGNCTDAEQKMKISDAAKDGNTSCRSVGRPPECSHYTKLRHHAVDCPTTDP